VKNFGRTQERLGRDATPVQANSSEVVAFDDGRLEAELRRANGGDIAVSIKRCGHPLN
jgi:hypothetical protein